MLEITLTSPERYDEDRNEFIKGESVTVRLQHSLVSLSKWESKWEIPFLGKENKTSEQTIDYVKIMCLDPVDPEMFNYIGESEITKIRDYISSKQTATWFTELKGKKGRSEVVTSELIYFWITSYQIPWEVQHWHLQRLLTLIEVFSRKNQKDKKMSKSEIMARNKALNEQRRKELGSPG